MTALLDEAGARRLFGLDAILPLQFWDSEPSCDRQPEQRLMLAILYDALNSLAIHASRSSARSALIAAEVRTWLASESRAQVFAFGSICDAVGLDATGIRAAIRKRPPSRARTAVYRRAYSGRGRHQVERLKRDVT